MLGIVLEVLHAQGLHEPVGHEGAGGDDGGAPSRGRSSRSTRPCLAMVMAPERVTHHVRRRSSRTMASSTSAASPRAATAEARGRPCRARVRPPLARWPFRSRDSGRPPGRPGSPSCSVWRQGPRGARPLHLAGASGAGVAVGSRSARPRAGAVLCHQVHEAAGRGRRRPTVPGAASGWYCTVNRGRSRWRRPSTVLVVQVLVGDLHLAQRRGWRRPPRSCGSGR